MNHAAITEQQPLSPTDLQTIDAYWRTANYLSAGQIYLMGNPLLTRPLRPEDVKPRLLGLCGTMPGLNLLEPRAYPRELGEDTPKIAHWVWPQ